MPICEYQGERLSAEEFADIYQNLQPRDRPLRVKWCYSLGDDIPTVCAGFVGSENLCPTNPANSQSRCVEDVSC